MSLLYLHVYDTTEAFLPAGRSQARQSNASFPFLATPFHNFSRSLSMYCWLLNFTNIAFWFMMLLAKTSSTIIIVYVQHYMSM